MRYKLVMFNFFMLNINARGFSVSTFKFLAIKYDRKPTDSQLLQVVGRKVLAAMAALAELIAMSHR